MFKISTKVYKNTVVNTLQVPRWHTFGDRNHDPFYNSTSFLGRWQPLESQIFLSCTEVILRLCIPGEFPIPTYGTLSFFFLLLNIDFDTSPFLPHLP